MAYCRATLVMLLAFLDFQVAATSALPGTASTQSAAQRSSSQTHMQPGERAMTAPTRPEM